MTPVELRDAINIRGLSLRAAAQVLAIDHANLWRYMHGAKPITAMTGDALRQRLADYDAGKR